MKTKHLQARIAYCFAIAECSTCVRRKFGAVIFDPKSNTDVSTGYNGPPRGGSKDGLCSGKGYCLRDGVTGKDLSTERFSGGSHGREPDEIVAFVRGKSVGAFSYCFTDKERVEAEDQAWSLLRSLISPPIPSGERTEIGCHHAEANAIANAARRGTPLEGCAIVVTGEPCLACAKLIHHVGIIEVFCVKGGYVGGGAGVNYLLQNKVVVTLVDGPIDPRSGKPPQGENP